MLAVDPGPSLRFPLEPPLYKTLVEAEETAAVGSGRRLKVWYGVRKVHGSLFCIPYWLREGQPDLLHVRHSCGPACACSVNWHSLSPFSKLHLYLILQHRAGHAERC